MSWIGKFSVSSVAAEMNDHHTGRCAHRPVGTHKSGRTPGGRGVMCGIQKIS